MFSPGEILTICEAYIEILEGEIQCLGECIDELGAKAEEASLPALQDIIKTLVDLKNNLNGTAEHFNNPMLSLPDDVRLKTKQIRALRSATLENQEGHSDGDN
jgi:hypothetical protein